MEKLRCLVMDLSLRVNKAQENVKTIQTLVQQWKDEPLFVRNDDHRAEGLLNVRGVFVVYSIGRYALMDGRKIKLVDLS